MNSKSNKGSSVSNKFESSDKLAGRAIELNQENLSELEMG